MSSTIEQIKSRLQITEVIGSYLSLEKAGANFKAKCPFHNEKTPSFFVSPERNSYYCFGCGAKGDIFNFVQEFESLDFAGALKVLAEKAGVTLSDNRGGYQEDKDKNVRLFRIMEDATIFFQSKLKDSKEALLYLKNRGLQIETVRNWRVGYAPEEWRSLKSYLSDKGYAEREMIDAGLIKPGDQGTYDRFRGRIQFPIFDLSHRVIAFSGRILNQNEKEAKYLNSPETPLFSKSKILYGMDIAKHTIREKGYAILVEGQMDLLMCQQAGFTNTVASSGTALTFDQIGMIRRLTDTLLIAYDSDNAGQNASFKAWQEALGSGIHIKAILLPQTLDPAEAILKDFLVWENAVKNAMHIVDYYINVIKSLSREESDLTIKEKILPLIRAIESPIDQSRFVNKLSLSSEIPENALWEELSKIEIEAVEKPLSKSKSTKSDYFRRALAYYLLLKKNDINTALDFNKKVGEIIDNIDLEKEVLAHDKDVLSFEAESYFGESPGENQSSEILCNLEEESLKKKFVETMQKMKRAEIEKSMQEVERYIKEIHEISQKISTLSKKYYNK